LKLCLKKTRSGLCVLPLLVALTGCGGDEEQAADTPAPVQETAPKPPPKKEEKAPAKLEPVKKEEAELKPIMKLTVDEPIKSDVCTATLGLGVLQVRNTPVAKSAVYPDVLIWSKAGVDNVKALEGNTFDAQVFVQKSAETTPLHVSDGATVKLKITKVSGKTIAGEVSGGSIFDIESEREIPLKCEFVAEIQ
jgi:hypothetical protein